MEFFIRKKEESQTKIWNRKQLDEKDEQKLLQAHANWKKREKEILREHSVELEEMTKNYDEQIVKLKEEAKVQKNKINKLDTDHKNEIGKREFEEGQLQDRITILEKEKKKLTKQNGEAATENTNLNQHNSQLIKELDDL